MKAFKWCLRISLILSLIAMPVTTYSGKALGLHKIVLRCVDGVGQCPKKFQQCYVDRDNCWRDDVREMFNAIDPPVPPCPCWNDGDLAAAAEFFDSGSLHHDDYCDGVGNFDAGSIDPNDFCEIRLQNVQTVSRFQANYDECTKREYSYFGDTIISQEHISDEELQSCRDGVVELLQTLQVKDPQPDLDACPCIREEFITIFIADIASGSNGIEKIQYTDGEIEGRKFRGINFDPFGLRWGSMGVLGVSVDSPQFHCSVRGRASESGLQFQLLSLEATQADACMDQTKRVWDELCGDGGYWEDFPDYDDRCKAIYRFP